MNRIGNLSNPNPWQRVNYLCGSHDQIWAGNSGVFITQQFGGRGNGYALAKARLAWALNVTLPGTPMLFMGTEGHLDGTWDPSLDSGDRRIDWSLMGDPTGAPMQQMVRDVNNLRWAHGALRSPGGSVVHTDNSNQIVAFTRYDSAGDVLLVVVNPSDGQWGAGDYGVNMGGETGGWLEVFNSQAPVYGGVNTVGNFGATLTVTGGQIAINLPSWSVLVFAKQ
jgi:1,4-alpha-glucan branching enzyme